MSLKTTECFCSTQVPYRSILDAVLRDLELPEAEYRLKECDGNKICITIYFHTSMMYLVDENPHMAIPRVHSGMRIC